MIEKILLDYLGQNLSVPVFMERPANPPSKYVLIEKTGSSKQNRICAATIAVQSYAPSLYEAAELNETVKAATENAVELNQICRVSLNSDYNFTNTAMKQYRYQAVFDITHY